MLVIQHRDCKCLGGLLITRVHSTCSNRKIAREEEKNMNVDWKRKSSLQQNVSLQKGERRERATKSREGCVNFQGEEIPGK